MTEVVEGLPRDEKELPIATVVYSETEGGSYVKMQRLVPFDGCRFLNKCNRSTPYNLLARLAWRP